jgi:hypothetical protein
MFGSSTIIRELALNLAKVIFILQHSVKLRRYLLCGCVAACCHTTDVEESERSSDSSTSAEGRKYGSTCARCCNYSLLVLLMMREGIDRNIWSCLQKYNKTVYSRILLDNH